MTFADILRPLLPVLLSGPSVRLSGPVILATLAHPMEAPALARLLLALRRFRRLFLLLYNEEIQLIESLSLLTIRLLWLGLQGIHILICP